MHHYDTCLNGDIDLHIVTAQACGDGDDQKWALTDAGQLQLVVDDSRCLRWVYSEPEQSDSDGNGQIDDHDDLIVAIDAGSSAVATNNMGAAADGASQGYFA